MDLDISTGPLSDSSKEDGDEEEEPHCFQSDVLGVAQSYGFSEGLILSSLVDSMTLEGDAHRPQSPILRGKELGDRLHTDRSISPSVSSSISVVSSLGGRRNLEWDSGADLGYIGIGGNPSSEKACVELSALEKLAIQNYKDILGPKNTSAFSPYRSKKKSHHYQEEGSFEVDKLRLKKFGDFLLRSNDHFESTPREPRRGSPVLRSYESISPLATPIGFQGSIRRPSRRSKSWSDIRSNNHIEGFSSRAFKNLRGSSPMEPSSSSSTSTVIPVGHQGGPPPRDITSPQGLLISNEGLPRGKRDESIKEGANRCTSKEEEEVYIHDGTSSSTSKEGEGVSRSTSKEEPSQEETEEEDIRRRGSKSSSSIISHTSEEETKIDKLQVRVIRSPPPSQDSLLKERRPRKRSRSLFRLYKSKLTHYIRIISTPSLTHAESKMKQRLAGKLMHLMRDEDEGECSNGEDSFKLEADMRKLDRLEAKLLKLIPPLGSLYPSDDNSTLSSSESSSRHHSAADVSSFIKEPHSTSSAVTSLPTHFPEPQGSKSSSTLMKRTTTTTTTQFISNSKKISSEETQKKSRRPHCKEANVFVSLSRAPNELNYPSHPCPLTRQCVDYNVRAHDFGQTYPSPDENPDMDSYNKEESRVDKANEFGQTYPSPCENPSNCKENCPSLYENPPSLHNQPIAPNGQRGCSRAGGGANDFGQTYPSPQEEPSASYMYKEESSIGLIRAADFGQTYPSPAYTRQPIVCTCSRKKVVIESKVQGLRQVSTPKDQHPVVQYNPPMDMEYKRTEQISISSSSSSTILSNTPLEASESSSSLLTRFEEIYWRRKPHLQPPQKKTNSFYFFEMDSHRGELEEEEDSSIMSKENRNIIANKAAGMDFGKDRARITRGKYTKRRGSDTQPGVNASKSVSESLLQNNPSFLAKSRARVKLLKESRRERLAEQDRRKAWLLSVASLSPRSRRRAEESYVPIRIKRVFNHRQIVNETRQRCKNLPEVLRDRREKQKKENIATNRIMLDLHNRKVQNHLFKRKFV